jgi:hypothetical protein
MDVQGAEEIVIAGEFTGGIGENTLNKAPFFGECLRVSG